MITPFRRWVIVGPKVAKVIEEFDDGNQHSRRLNNMHHPDQKPFVQAP
jgi:hypothetical protein